jgi:regulator of protease activity HflC (stomatin/prohibitin superfamily)
MTPFFVLSGIVLLLILMSVKVAKEYHRAVIFRLGRFHSVRGPGLYLVLPFIETKNVLDIRTRTVDIERQEAITKDSVTITINAVLWFKVVEPAKAIIDVANYQDAVYQIALTTFRNIIGQHQLDEILKDRDTINNTLQDIVDKVTDPWGIKVERVEMKDVEIPASMQRAMAQEAEAIREKRARIIKAESEFEASQKLSDSAKKMAENPIAIELRRMQMIAEIGSEQNTTTIIFIPTEFTDAARSIASLMKSPKE